MHGAKADGSVAYRRKLSRGKLLVFLAMQPKCTVAMEACGGAHWWGRQIVVLGHEVRLVPPIYVKPFVKRSKNDAADAEAITEAAQRPTMHFVAVKTEAQQAQGMLFRRPCTAPSGGPGSPAWSCPARRARSPSRRTRAADAGPS